MEAAILDTDDRETASARCRGGDRGGSLVSDQKDRPGLVAGTTHQVGSGAAQALKGFAVETCASIGLGL